MAEPKTEPQNQVAAEDRNSSTEEKAHDELRSPAGSDVARLDSDIEQAREDVDQHPKMTWRRFMAIFSLGCLLAAAQLPIYLIGGSVSYIYADIGGATTYAWLAISYTLALAAVAPFAGAISDLMGRRYVAMLGALLVIVGMIITGTAQKMDVAIGGMAISGAGAGLAELIGAAGVAELAPVKNRGFYIGTIFLLILPFAASAGYAQLYSASATWRWGAWIVCIIMGGTLALLILFYWPPPRINSSGLTRRQVLARVDYLGGVLSIGGFALFILAISWGGYNYPWHSAHVIVTLTLGLVMILAFCIWEYFAPYPMIPGYIFKNKRISVLTLFITAVAGANFYSMLNFWPLECQQFFGPDPHAIARTVIAFGFSVATGVILVSWGLSVFRGANRELLVISSVFMTAGVGGLAAVTPTTPSLGIGLSFLGGLGVGGIIVPAAVILTIICPDEVIATVTAITLSIRLIGGSIGYAIYFNVLQNKLTAIIPSTVGIAALKAGLPPAELTLFITALIAKNTTAIAGIKGVTPNVLVAAEAAVNASYVQGFKLIYLVSIAFGGAAIIASVFLGDIRKYMVDRVAVDIH